MIVLEKENIVIWCESNVSALYSTISYVILIICRGFESFGMIWVRFVGGSWACECLRDVGGF